MTCLTCTRFSLKDSPLGKFGFGKCELYTLPGATVSMNHTCDKHQAVPEVEAKKRQEWKLTMGKGK